MKLNFDETIKQKTDDELEAISKDYMFYSEEERLVALSELEMRNSLTKEQVELKKDIEKEVKNIKKVEKESLYKITFKALLPQRNYLCTPILIYINIFIFMLMALSGMNIFDPSIDKLVQWGGNIRHLTINGQSWRLFTSMFLHAGLLHLLFNMYALLYAGALLEKVIGRNKFVFAYLISGIAASVTSLVVHDNTVSIGASGAIFGLFGVLITLLVLRQFKSSDIPAKGLLLNISFFILYNITIGFRETGIDNAAHIGGLFGGIVTGLVYCFAAKWKIRSTIVGIGLTLIAGCLSVWAVTGVSDKIGEYDMAIEEFIVNEEKALWMYREDIAISDSSRSQYLDRLKKEGVAVWERNIQMFQKLKTNGYEEQLDKQIDLLIEYSTLRKKSCQLMIALVDGSDSPETPQELQDTNLQIEDKLTELEDLFKVDNQID